MTAVSLRPVRIVVSLVTAALVVGLGLYLASWPSSVRAPATDSPRVATTKPRGHAEEVVAAERLLATSATEAERGTRDDEARARAEREKEAFASRPATQPSQLSEAVKADPDLYEAGPGPHLERYGGRSGALPATLEPEDAEVTTVLESEGPFPKLAVWVPSYRVSSGAEVSLQARLVGEDGQGVMADSVSATIVEKETGASSQRVLTAATAGNYQVAFKPPPPKGRVAQYEYVVYAMTKNADGGEALRSAQGAFQVHGSVARVLAAEAQAMRRGGDVELELPVQIDAAGDYTFYAELWGGDDGKISVAFGLDKANSLAPGRYVAKITFGGLIIRDRKASGPFVIRNVRVRRITDFPFVEADPVPVLLKTPAWSAETFR